MLIGLCVVGSALLIMLLVACREIDRLGKALELAEAFLAEEYIDCRIWSKAHTNETKAVLDVVRVALRMEE